VVPMIITYIIPRSLLERASKALQPPERLCFVTGIKLLDARVIILTELVRVKCATKRSSVLPSPASVRRAEQYLQGLGMELEAQFHSHPGKSAAATFPSDID